MTTALDPARHARLLTVLSLALLAHAVVATFLILRDHPLGVDLLPIWTAARLLVEHPASVYDFAAVTRAQAWLLGEIVPRPAPYPPSALMLAAPLGALPFWWAYAGLTIVSAAFASTIISRGEGARGRAVILLTLLAPPSVLGALAGQVHFIILGLVTGGVVWLPGRPRLAGALIGVAMAIKPSLLLLAPLALLAGGGLTAAVSAGLAGAALVAGSALLFGLDPWLAWVAALPRFLELVREDPQLIRCLVAPTALARQLGLPEPAIVACNLVFAGVAAAMIWTAFRTPRPLVLRLAALGAGCLMATPYAMNYEAVLLAPAAAMLLAGAKDERGFLLALAAYVAVGLGRTAYVAPLGLLAFAIIVCGPMMRQEARGLIARARAMRPQRPAAGPPGAAAP